MKKERQIGVFVGGRWWRHPHLLTLPRDTWKELKAFYQRGMYGYAYSDVWNLNDYLASVIVPALAEMRDQGMVDHKASGMEIDLMISGFEAFKENSEILFEEDTHKLKDNWQDIEKENEQRRLEGMKHFIDEYHGLWW